MSTVERPAKRRTLPPLEAGQHLDQPTFHERYEAMPPDTRAELVGGVVYMPSPLRDDHGEHGQRRERLVVPLQGRHARSAQSQQCHGQAR